MEPIILYATPTCLYSKMAREFFIRHRVPFEERNVLLSPLARREMVDKSHQRGVPVIDTGEEIFVGFDRSALERALGLRG